jgi:hypothetical protein
VKTFLVLLLFFSACSEPFYYVCVERGCPSAYEAAAVDAIDEINRQYAHLNDGDELIEYGGLQRYEVDNVDADAAKNDVDVIICSGAEGRAPYGYGIPDGDIILYTERIPADDVLIVALHEVGHYIGMHHSDNEASVMFGFVTDSQAAPWFMDADWDAIE